jgi:hypothetical protein
VKDMRNAYKIEARKNGENFGKKLSGFERISLG